MAFDLCQVPQAVTPYFIENISTNIWSIEELCFYLYENIYLVDETICNEKLCDWIRDELGLKKLYRILYDNLDGGMGIGNFVVPIFRQVGYLTTEQTRQYLELLGRIQVQPEDIRQKEKGDYLVRCGMYFDAITQYRQILTRQGAGKMGAVFYAGVWNNLGAAQARLFEFAEAAGSFEKAWKMVPTKESLRRYVSVLPFFLSEEEARQRISALEADPEMLDSIREYNAHLAQKAVEEVHVSKESKALCREMQQLRENYRKSAGCMR